MEVEFFFEIIIFSVISDNTKNKQLHGGVWQNTSIVFFFYFFEIPIFRSAGIVIQQIKKSRLTRTAIFPSASVKSYFDIPILT